MTHSPGSDLLSVFVALAIIAALVAIHDRFGRKR